MKTLKWSFVAIIAIFGIFAFIACGGGGGGNSIHEHNWGNWEVTTPPTFITEGKETRTCSLDPFHTETRTKVLPITTGEEWTTAIGQIAAKKNAGYYTLTISGDIGVAGGTDYTFGTTADGSGLSVTLKGNGKLYLTSRGIIININANQTVIIDSKNLTLEGLTNGKNGATQDNTASVVLVEGSNGTLELKNGTISGNTTSYPGGGGVHVGGGGTFTMHGGTISDNTGGKDIGGGGVHVFFGGTFTMHGGTISGNSTGFSIASGGGVRVFGGTFTMFGGVISGNYSVYCGGVSVRPDTGSIFRIVTGTIYGTNESTASLRNTVDPYMGEWAALSIASDGTGQRGTFSGANGAWVSKANLTPSNNTIKVKDGEIVP
jgi:hypothetical protein